MSTLLAPSTVLPSLLDDNDFEFPGSLLNNDFWARPSRVFNAPFFRNGGLPAVNVKDAGKSFDLELAVPGYKKEDLKVNVTDGVLTVASEMKKETEDEKNGYMRREFNYRSFQRSFQLPENADGDQVKATYVDGVLKLSVPKMKAVPEKKGKEVRIG
ncbi:MAG: Hsp20/alpha crystallin family protein [Flavobacteriales bacterium]|nr:Hsp20/alpha crystallin family protein [Flavobacteriales bacterium]